VAWKEALLLLADQVSKPTFEAHIRTLRPVGVSEDNEVSLAVPSVFTRSWIEKRHVPAIANALSVRLGRAITVCLIEHKSGEAT
jgi:chromosomal replication initiation ATPase DnaA